jgi:hypothetical protein
VSGGAALGGRNRQRARPLTRACRPAINSENRGSVRQADTTFQKQHQRRSGPRERPPTNTLQKQNINADAVARQRATRRTLAAAKPVYRYGGEQTRARLGRPADATVQHQYQLDSTGTGGGGGAGGSVATAGAGPGDLISAFRRDD